MIEREYTYLAKTFPEGLEDCPSRLIVDVYIPASADHPQLRLRKNGNTYELCKKCPVQEGDASEQHEYTIPLSEAEYAALERQVQGKRVAKKRYAYPYQGRTLEVDVFIEGLVGLVLVDVEFETQEERESFSMPDFCLANITQEKFIAGGMICGKSYADIQEKLMQYGYTPLQMEKTT